MSWTLPTGVYKQPDETEGRTQQDDKSHSFVYKGPYSTLASAADGFETGDEIETGWCYSSHELRRVPGDLGVLTITCMPASSTDGEGETQPLKDIWSIQAVRNDVSVMAYCGVSPGANPLRGLIEAWMKEPDGELAEDLSFRKPDGSVFEISPQEYPATVALIEKIRKGVESVIRFYAVVIRTRTYADCPPACLENIGFIDTPPAPAGTAKHPSGLTNAVTAHQWLKVRDDAQQLTDGNWTRIEAWWGIAKTDDPDDSPWDADLYGVNRWPMPYVVGGGDPT